MGLDLTLLPIGHDTNDWGFAHTMIQCDRHAALFEAIMEVEKTESGPVPDAFHTYLSRGEDGDYCYGKTQTTPYGEKIRAVRVRDLVPLKSLAKDYNAAAWAYLEQLPPNSRVALYWH